ncbi:hypothetical protein PR202_gb03983 [Eleusine coracana subsp. coracana]|uniref:At1g61320/AtMIF1 LRR domain-containing protein n=1 Tax=Eleusine coracana subsp. coracana TaxID=191504 RepID=A0AAV5E2D3_ELECO|nr:hypothetical protein PR202_gb03983 [Eleusine coracana subsp. coracana]
MTKLHLYQVRITGDELRHLIANSFALEHLELSVCHEIICLNIPHWLVRLRYLQVFRCKMLQVVECTAPNLSTFHLFGDPVQLTLCESSKVKNVNVGFSDEFSIICYAINKFPSIVPNLETLTISSAHERVNTPVVADKFLHLKYLKISLRFYDENSLPNYDYLSLASFLDASPVLETFILSVNQAEMKHDSVLEDAYHTRHIRQRKHERLSEVQINGFCSAKSIVDLTCHILENATSLESLTVDTIFNLKADGNISRCSGQKSGECRRLDRNMILEAHKALCVIRTYILKRVPPTVEFNVGEPCSRCHAL